MTGIQPQLWTEVSPVGDEHGWRLGRIIDPFGQEWEVGAPRTPWPPDLAGRSR